MCILISSYCFIFALTILLMIQINDLFVLLFFAIRSGCVELKITELLRFLEAGLKQCNRASHSSLVEVFQFHSRDGFD